jgi:hypothetical protein
MSKTVETSVVYNRKVESTDEIELMEKKSDGSTVEDGYGFEHNYIREW